MRDTEAATTERESGDCSQTGNREYGSYLGNEGNKVPYMEGARIVEREVTTEKRVPESCLLFAEIGRQLLNTEATNTDKNLLD